MWCWIWWIYPFGFLGLGSGRCYVTSQMKYRVITLWIFQQLPLFDDSSSETQLQPIVKGLSNPKEVNALEETTCRSASQASAINCINQFILTPFSGKTSMNHLKKKLEQRRWWNGCVGLDSPWISHSRQSKRRELATGLLKGCSHTLSAHDHWS